MRKPNYSYSNDAEAFDRGNFKWLLRYQLVLVEDMPTVILEPVAAFEPQGISSLPLLDEYWCLQNTRLIKASMSDMQILSPQQWVEQRVNHVYCIESNSLCMTVYTDAEDLVGISAGNQVKYYQLTDDELLSFVPVDSRFIPVSNTENWL